jgi:hypothetical protein
MTGRRALAATAIALGALAGISGGGAATAAPEAVLPCRSIVDTGVLPVWARGGFSDPKPRIPHVLGRSRKIVAILFAYPLLSPPPRDHNNKILWVARRANGAALRIRAQRMVGSDRIGAPVSRTIAGGPGPSIVNLPAPGCWRFTLRWASQTDTLDLRYHRRS